MSYIYPHNTIRRLKSNHNHYYVKLSDENFSWWRLEDMLKPEKERMQVRMTDEMVLSESHFKIETNVPI